MIDYKNKYLKYKNKYLKLKGGMNWSEERYNMAKCQGTLRDFFDAYKDTSDLYKETINKCFSKFTQKEIELHLKEYARNISNSLSDIKSVLPKVETCNDHYKALCEMVKNNNTILGDYMNWVNETPQDCGYIEPELRNKINELHSSLDLLTKLKNGQDEYWHMPWGNRFEIPTISLDNYI